MQTDIHSHDESQRLDPDASQGWAAYRGLLVFIVLAGAGVWASHYLAIGELLHADAVADWVRSLGVWGPALIVLLGCLTPLLFLPRWPLAMVSGLLYGVVGGALLATLASTLGAALHYGVARRFLSGATDRLGRRYNLERWRIPPEGQFLAVFLMRAFPLSSFVATNLLAGALRMRFRRYLLASMLGMLPSSFMYAAWGKLLKKPDASYYLLAVLTLVLFVVGTVWARGRLRGWRA
jgi:uncharacterized membrane protein YdjX (TVP38/TMEM64 family)